MLLLSSRRLATLVLKCLASWERKLANCFAHVDYGCSEKMIIRLQNIKIVSPLMILSQSHCIIIQGGKACSLVTWSDAKLQEESRGIPGKLFNHFDSDGKSKPSALIILMFLLIDALFQVLFITDCCGGGWGSICSAARLERGGVGLEDLILEEEFKVEVEFELEVD